MSPHPDAPRRDFAERKEEVRIDKTVFPGQTEVKVDITYLRWLWWPAILYLFWSMAHVCDIHFVRTIEVTQLPTGVQPFSLVFWAVVPESHSSSVYAHSDWGLSISFAHGPYC